MLNEAKRYLLNLQRSEYNRALLALSGGPDSISLYRLLMELNSVFAVCYVNDDWYVSSDAEEEYLADMCRKDGIRFYSERVRGLDYSRNVENLLRKKRLEAFAKVYKEYGATHLILGHHKNDQVETILKRILEGSGLSALGGISTNCNLKGMHVVRPLLYHTKEEILDFLNSQSVHFFEDPTNQDTKYLRARMRKETIPFLRDSFGKNFSNNLVRFGRKMRSLQEYIGDKLNAFVEDIVVGPLGIIVPLKSSLHYVEIEFLIDWVSKKYSVKLSGQEFDTLVEAIVNWKESKRVDRDKWQVVYEKGHLFFICNPQEVVLEMGVQVNCNERGWLSLWKGMGWSYAPSNNCCVGYVDIFKYTFNGMILNKWYSIHGIPSVVRKLFPVVLDNGKVVSEMLTNQMVKFSQNQILTFKLKNNNICHCVV